MQNDGYNDSVKPFAPLTRSERKASWLSGGGVFLLALIVYWLTVAPSASYWDCPEYILTAVRLEVGHPPGNPLWALFHRMLTIFAPPDKAALVINMASGFFTALAAGLLTSMVTVASARLLRYKKKPIPLSAGAAGGLCAGLMFAWCDSAWFSAVEAEVYAMSILLTALTLWLMLRWTLLPAGPKASRQLLLIVYITGLSLGVHQLNLLSLPVLALIYLWRRSPRKVSFLRIAGYLLLSFVAVVVILKGMMPGTVQTAGRFELFAVNILGLPYNSGWILYLILLLFCGSLSIFLTSSSSVSRLRSGLGFLSVLVFLLLSGIFFPTVSPWIALGVSTAVAIWFFVLPCKPSLHKVMMGLWSISLLIIGYSTLMLIPLRGAASPYLNTGFVSDPFSLYSYIEREQYGGTPLLKGRTPYSKGMFVEEWNDSVAKYGRMALKKGNPVWRKAIPGAVLSPRSGFLTAADSAANLRAISSSRDAYVLSDYRYQQIMTPELDMWLPRITSGRPSDLDAYYSWIGMDTTSMTRVEISEAFDTLGNPVGKMGSDGKRIRKWSYRPTYLQNLQYFLGYQTGYMYFRYLLWNFAGRQNDICSSGEADHGNFLTGFTYIDNAMLGDQAMLPPDARTNNRGWNVYLSLPLLLCIFGAVVLTRSGKPGRRASFAILMLFLLTGVAIVVYLNQTIGEPRERDYSFLGSFFAFAAWGGFGASRIVAAISERFASKWVKIAATILVLTIPGLMLAENYDDHDRSGRNAATDFASNILESLEPNAIIFVDGDNYTFPLWYVQEVLNVRKDVTVVSLSYLSLPQYVCSLLQPGEEALPVSMYASPQDISYGRHVFSRFPNLAIDTVAVEASEFLTLLYGDRGPRSISPSSKILMPTEGDTLLIDLRNMAAKQGSSMLTQKQLALIDIVASNQGYRPIYWLNNVPPNSYAGMFEATTPELFAHRFGKSRPHFGSGKLPEYLKWGGMNSAKHPYADPTVQYMVSGQRVALIRHGRRLLEEGDAKGALAYAIAASDSLPAAVSPFGYSPSEGKSVRDGVELANLLLDIGETTADENVKAKGNAIFKDEIIRVLSWEKWRDSLPPYLRNAVSFRTNQLLSQPIDSIIASHRP